MTVPRPTLAHAARDSKLVLALVIVALLAAVVALSLAHLAVPEALNAAVVGAVGSLAGVSVPTHALTSAEEHVASDTYAQDMDSARAAIENILGRIATLERGTTRHDSLRPASGASPLPDPSPAS